MHFYVVWERHKTAISNPLPFMCMWGLNVFLCPDRWTFRGPMRRKLHPNLILPISPSFSRTHLLLILVILTHFNITQNTHVRRCPEDVSFFKHCFRYPPCSLIRPCVSAVFQWQQHQAGVCPYHPHVYSFWFELLAVDVFWHPPSFQTFHSAPFLLQSYRSCKVEM